MHSIIFGSICGLNGIAVVKGGIGGITGCKGTILLDGLVVFNGGLGVLNAACCGIESGTRGSDVVGNASGGKVGLLAFVFSEVVQS